MKNLHYKSFDIAKLKKIKKHKRLTVGLALPVLNEELTLKKTLEVVKSCGDLIDRIIVVDSDSTDCSVKICHEMGIKVVSDNEFSKVVNMPLVRGKGWALWSSIYFLDTDIIAWIDADIKNISARFITGIVGPMIMDDKVIFTKGYYRRPKGDARVTEISVRPLINFFFPELRDFVQPLSGEYGGRREFLENIFFYSGYSVEIAVLIQASLHQKSSNICQVYLGKRIHELQSVASLGKMSSSIMRTLFMMAEENGRLVLVTELPKELYRFASAGIGDDFSKEKVDIADIRLPKIKEVLNV